MQSTFIELKKNVANIKEFKNKLIKLLPIF